MGDQRGSRVWRPAKDHRHRVAEATLNRASDPVGLGRGPTLGDLAGQDGAVVADQHDRGDGIGVVAQGGHFDPPVTGHGGGGEGGS